VTKSVAAAEFAPSAPPLFSDSGTLAQNMVEAYLAVRDETDRRAAPLSPEDQLIQSMQDASPAKWHRAPTTWFFEQFLLGEHCPGYTVFHPDYAYLFNSYYVSAGPRPARSLPIAAMSMPPSSNSSRARARTRCANWRRWSKSGSTTSSSIRS